MSHCLKRTTIKSCNGEKHTSLQNPTTSQETPPFIPVCPSNLIPPCEGPPLNTVEPSSPCVTCKGNYTDFYCVGKLWVNMVKTALFGVNLKKELSSLMPVVEAKEEDKKNKDPVTPCKPCMMKYKDLPLYSSPHFEYKDFVEKSKRCKDYDVKLLHEALAPTVGGYRKSIQTSYNDLICGLCCTYKEVRGDVLCTFDSCKTYFRDPKRSDLRQGVVITSTLLAYILARKKSISKRILYTGIGALGSGFLCFPEETDVAFRTMLYHFGKTTVYFYNLMCKKVWNIRERVPCERDLPEVKKVACLKESKIKK